MSTATDTTMTPSNKRTRFSENDVTTPSSSSSNLSQPKVQPPKILAESFIRTSIASLHPIIATDIEKLGKEHITLLSKKNHLDKANQRLVNDNDLIPSSARIKFELSVSDRVKEMPEYKALQEKTIEVVNEAHKGLKVQIVDASKLEIKAIMNEIQEHLVKAIRLITSSFLLLLNDKTNIDEAVYLLVKNYITDLSIHTPMNLKDFITLYKKVHTIETFPPRSSTTTTATTTTTTTTTPSNRNSTVSPFFGGTSARSTQMSQQQEDDTTEVVTVNSNITKIKDTIENVFVSSWSRFLEQQQKNELSIELKKLSQTYFTTRSTSDATAIVDAEPAADKKQLKALIRLETIAETKNLLKKMNDMQKELNTLKSSKNSTKRGNVSASATKTRTPNTTTNNTRKNSKKKSNSKQKSGQNNKRKAADNNNGKDSDAKSSKKKSGNNKSKRNGKSSSKKKPQQNNKSSKK